METATKTNKPINLTPEKLLWAAFGLFCCSCIFGVVPCVDALITIDNTPATDTNMFIRLLAAFSYLFLGFAIISNVAAILWLLYRLIRYDERIKIFDSF
jgi:hypothetical protein